MKNPKHNYIVGVIALCIAGVGAYMIFKGKLSGKTGNAGGGNTGGGTGNAGGGGTGGGNAGGNTAGTWSKFIVATNTSNLNVRQSPSTSSTSIGSLPKGMEIYARPSSTDGWH
mgnify:CR=1 FL=1